MNKKGQAIGGIILLVISLIVGLVLLTDGISDGAAQVTSLKTVANQSAVFPAAGASLEIAGCANYQGTPLITNSSAGMEVIPSTNYTFSAGIGADSQKSLFLNGLTALGYNSKAVNLSYTCVPDGYSEDSLGRVFPPIIILLCALALAVTAIAFAIKGMGMFG